MIVQKLWLSLNSSIYIGIFPPSFCREMSEQFRAKADWLSSDDSPLPTTLVVSIPSHRKRHGASSAPASTDSDSSDHKKPIKKRSKIHKKYVRKDSSKWSKVQSIFREHYSTLVSTISSCLLQIANKLYSKNVIPAAALSQVLTNQGTDEEKASKLLL